MLMKYFFGFIIIVSLIGIKKTYAQGFNMTDGTVINTCTGTFYDSGGPTGDYINDENLTYTICPSTGGGAITVDFTFFQVETFFDDLSIYDGNNTSAPLIGVYTGGFFGGGFNNNIPGFIAASPTNTSGCLTFIFDSDVTITRPGWAATIGCTQNCQDIIANATFSPAPDADGIIRVCQGTTVNFNGSGTYPQNNTNYAQSDTTSLFLWDTNDGSTPQGQNASHTFNTPGSYNVSLQIQDVAGCTTAVNFTQEIRVSTTPDFSGTAATPDTICLGSQASVNGVVSAITFDNTTSQPSISFTPTIVSQNWQTNPTIVSGTNPIIVEPVTTGNTCYTYEVTDNFGCDYDTTVCITVNVNPVIDPIPNIEQCDPYTLPPITGVNLSGNEAYFTGTDRFGTQYSPGDVISSFTGLFINDSGTAPTFCEDETPNISINIFNSNIQMSCPPDITTNCAISEQPAYATFADFQNAGGSAVTNFSAALLPNSFTLLSEVSDGNSCPETVTRTYQIEDDCGSLQTCTQTITINDDINPTGSVPALTIQCIGDLPAPDVTIITNEADNCTVNPIVTFGGDISDGNTCPEIIIRTYNIADDCGNNIDVTQTITINDDINPTGTAPADITVQCIEDVPPADITLITDEADNCTLNPIVTHIGDISDGNTCPEIITRTYNIEDSCGNNIDVTQIITINDDINPTGTAPADLTLQCIEDVPIPEVDLIIDEADNCTANPIVTFVSDISDNNTCPEIISRTYNIADDCGNNINLVQTITINDDILPTAGNVTTTVQCLTDVPTVDISVIADEADNCTANPTVDFVSESTDGNTCNGEIITRMYSVTDDCGNSITVNHTITIDAETPIFSVSGAGPNSCEGTDGIITLSGLNPTTNYLMSYDGGTTNPITTNAFGDYLITGLPSGSYTNYTVADADCPACATTVNVSINLNDPTAAPIDAGPDIELCEGTQFTLNAINPGGANLSWDNGATDGIGFIPPVGTTFYTITAERVNCFSSDQMVITVSPAITDITSPADLTAVCSISEQPAYINFNAFIAAGGSATIPNGGVIDSTSFVLFSEVSDGNTCPETVVRTYQIADTCGVTVSSTQTIVINDIVNPTGTAPLDLAVQCIGDVPVPDILSIADEADNCTVNPIVTFVSDISDGNTCPEIITRTYNIADDCGNNIDVIQTFTINDDINPTGTAPAAVLVQCIEDVPVPDILSITDEADNCTVNPIVTFVSDVSNGNTCPEIITRTYNIADDCGNNINVTQIITIDDDLNPTGTAAPIFVQCIGDVPLPDVLVITDEADNCTVNPIVTFVGDVSDGNTCPEIITRTYNIADDCGNNIDVDQIITINDDINPTATAPIDLLVQCIEDVPVPAILSITDEADNCTVNPIITNVGDVSDGNTCPEIITRTYNSADDCGNNIDVIQTITVNDDTDPTATAPADLVLQCIGDVPAADILSITDEADNCTVNPIVTFVSDVSDGNTCPEVITRTYNIADDCGNNIDVTQTITINDDTNPTGTPPPAVLVQCIGDVPLVDITLITDEADNCTVAPVVNHLSDVSDGNTCPEIITRTYNITDDCGNNIDITQLITVNDDVDPTATAPPAEIVQCFGDIPTPDILTITDEADNCSVGPIVAHVSDVSDGNTCAGEVITRTYSVTDDCGNSIDLIQTFTLDLFAPVFSVSGTNTTTCLFGDGTITLSGLNPLANYEVGYNGGTPFSATTNASGDYVITGLSAGTYTNFVVTEANCLACTTTVNTSITLLDPDPPFVSAGPDLELCEDETVTLTAANPENAAITWNNAVIDGVPFIQSVGTIVYTVTATSILGCVETDQVEVIVHPKPDVVFAANFTEGCAEDEINITSLTSGIGNQCRFTINGGNPIIGCNINQVFSVSGCYDVNLEVETINGCVDDLTISNYICIDDYPIANFTVSPDELSTFKNEAEFTNLSSGAATYQWDFDDENFSNQTNPNHIFTIDEEISETAFNIELIAFSNLGCADTATKTLPYFEDLIYYIPNTFSPDGNKFNELFKPIFQSGFDPLDYKLQIFNRWGELIFESNNAEIGWDGTYGTKQTGIVKEGVYVWKIGFKTLRNDERVEEVGSVNLLR